MRALLLAAGLGVCVTQGGQLDAGDARSLAQIMYQDRHVSLDHPIFAPYSEVCLIGWDRMGILPGSVREACGNVGDHRVIGIVRETGRCHTLARMRKEVTRDISVAGELDVLCRSLPDGGSLEVVSYGAGQFDTLEYRPPVAATD